MDMAFPAINYCKSTSVDTKKQNNRPIFQPLRLLSTAATTMHQTKNIDFPFVPLTGHKLINDHCIPTNFDIMNDHANFGDFSFDKGNSFTKNTSLKGCNQFPVFSISQLVGGFVGSKSQLRTESRESPQIWDIVFKKLDEFITSRTAERYGFQTLSQNIFESLCEKSDPALGLAASYILAGGCQSFKNTTNIENIVKSSPTTQNSVKIIPTPVSSCAPLGSFIPSHSSCNKSPVPVSCESVEHLVSQPDVTQHQNVTVGLGVPLELVVGRPSVIDHLVPATVVSVLSTCEIPSEEHLNLDQFQDNSSLHLTEGKQSYAEVAKMAHTKSKMSSDRHASNGLMSNSKQHRNVNNRNYSRNCRDPRQRYVDSSNWRIQGRPTCSGQKGFKRDINRGPLPLTIKSDVSHWKSGQNLKTIPSKLSQCQQRKNNERLKRFKSFNGSALNTVLEIAPDTGTKQILNEAKSFVGPTCKSRPNEDTCQFYNLNKKSCMNWRCRQHLPKTSVKRNLKHILDDSDTSENLYDQTTSADLPSCPNDQRAVKPNTLENYIGPAVSPHPRPARSKTSGDLKQTQCDSKSGVQCLPMPTYGMCMGIPICSKSSSAADLRKIPENCRVAPSPVNKERVSSESSDSNNSIPRSRSISEESRASSSSACSINSCKIMSEANLRRRFSSECDSEDSFVIFDGDVDCIDYDSDSLSSASSDLDSDSESGDDEFDATSPRVSIVICMPLETDENEFLSPKMKEVNAKWERSCSSPGKKPSCKKVHFAASPCLTTVHPMVAWDYAYRAARLGPWEELARDRERFKQRVERSAPFLAPVLEAAHRDRVSGLLLSAGRHDLPREPTVR